MKLIMENWRSYISDESLEKNCVLYLREAKEIKKVDLDDLIKQCESGLINENRLHNIWRSSTLYESYRFGTYVEAFRSLNEHMISEGLIYKSGSLTKKGKILERKEKDLNDDQFKLITEKFEKSINERGLKLLLEQEEEPSEEDKEIAQMAADSRTGFQKAAGALGKGLKTAGKGIWSAVSAPFKVIEWFRDKIWEGMSALFQKLWEGLKALGEKYDVGFIKKLVVTAEKIVGMVKSFCQKNKVIQIICSIVKTVVVTFLVSLAIKAMMAALGGATSLAITAAVGGCGAGAAAGLASESLKLNEATGAYCEMVAKAGKAATSGTLNVIKGAIKFVAAEQGRPQDQVTAALKWIDDFQTRLGSATAFRTGKYEFSESLFEFVKEEAKNAPAKGKQLLQTALRIVDGLIDNYKSEVGHGIVNIGRKHGGDFIFGSLRKLGEAANVEDNMNVLYGVFDQGIEAFKAMQSGDESLALRMANKGKNLLKALGWSWDEAAALGDFDDAGEGLGAMADFVSK